MIHYVKKHWSNILFATFILAMLIPKTRMPIMVFVQRTLAIGPSVKKNKPQLHDYYWEMTKADGQRISFVEAENEVVLLNFWATWCPPCIAEMPSMQRLYDTYGDKVKFYLVTDENPDKVQAFIEKNNYTLPIYYSSYALPKLLQSRALPTTFILGKDGKIHIKETGVAKWDSKRVQELLDRLLEE